jgi:hypothetical protein
VNGALVGQCAQILEFVAPVAFEYVFAGHREHVDLPMSSWNLPGVQSVQIKSVSPFECFPF